MDKNKEIKFRDGVAYIGDFNSVGNDTILRLNDIDIPIEIAIKTNPNQEKLRILNNEILAHKASSVSLSLHAKDKVNWVNLRDFKNINLIEHISIYNTTKGFNSIEGIQDFKNLKSFELIYFYEKELDLNPLSLCKNLETLVLDIALTKSHHESISNLEGLKNLKVRKLKTSYLTKILINIELLTVYTLQDTFLDSKMPNIKKLRIFNSNGLENVNFLSSLTKLDWFYLYGLNNVYELPDFSNLPTLSKVVLHNMKRLKSIYTLTTIKQLIGLAIRSTSVTLDMIEWLTPKNFPYIRNMLVELKTKKETEILLDRFKSIEITKNLNLS